MNRRYLVMAHNYWPALGGAEKVLQSIAENLHKVGEEVEVLTSNAKNSAVYFMQNPETVGAEEEIINGVLVRREDIRNVFQKISRHLWLSAAGGRSIFQRLGKVIWRSAFNEQSYFHAVVPLLGPHFVKFVCRYIFAKKYSHIICGPFPTSVPLYGYLLKKIHPKTKFIIDPSLHLDDPMHTGRVVKFLAKRADAFLVRSREETLLLNSWGIDSQKILELGVGIDEKLMENGGDGERNQLLPASGYILYLGQEVPHKNILILLKAMQKVWNNGYRTGVLIAGARTAYSGTIDRYIESLEPDARKLVFRVNDFDESLKKDLINNCKFFAMPSSQESFGIVFIEAWARKKAVIGANVPGVRYLIGDHENGLLFRNGDPDDLAQKIFYLLENQDIAATMGEKGYETVLEKFQWNRIIKRILSI